MSDFDDFDARARAAGRGLGAVAPNAVDPARPRQRLRRRRIASATAAVALLGAIGGGVALASGDSGRHAKVRVANSDETTIPPAPTTETEATTTLPATSTTTSTTPPLTWIGPPLVCVIDGNVVGVSVDGPVQGTTDGGYTLAYLLGSGEIWGRTDSVIVKPDNGAAHTIPDVTLVGAGTYHGDDVAITLDFHPDVLHSGRKWISLYDLKTGTLTRTQLSIAPGTKLDRVSVAGDLFVMSGASAEGGPFVLYRHIDGSFDDTLPNIVAGQLGIGSVSDAVISPDGSKIAYMVDAKDLLVNDVRSGKVLERVRVAAALHQHAGPIDFDGRYVVIERRNASATTSAEPLDVVVDTNASQPVPVEEANARGTATIVPQ